MWLPFLLFGVTVLGCFAAILVGMSVSDSMQMGDYIRLMVIFSPLLIVAVLGSRKYWLAIAIGLLPLGISLPIQFLRQFPLVVVYGAMLFLLVLGGFCFRQFAKVVIRDWASSLIMLAGLIVLGRVLWDRPGSALLGGEGGGAQALVMLMSFCAFWAVSKIAAEEDWIPGKVLFLAFVILLVVFIQRYTGTSISMLKSTDLDETSSGGGFLVGLYSRPGWLLGSFVFAWILCKHGIKKGTLVLNQNLLLAISGLLAVSAFTGHRSRPLFAFGTIMFVSYVYREHKKVLFFGSVFVAIAMTLLIGMGRDVLPPVAKRTLSIVIPVSQEEANRMRAESGTGGEVGWESEFRSKLYALGWNKIKSSPVFGAGFGFSAREIIRLIGDSDQLLGAKIAQLALVGGYHNAVLQLAVGAGLPCAFFFTLGFVILILQSAKRSVLIADGTAKLFAAVVLGCIPPIFGQMLMNGAAQDMFRCCILLGILNGISINRRFRKVGDPEWVPEKKVQTPKLSEGDIPAGFGGPLKW
jgi:O-antigen ligase